MCVDDHSRLAYTETTGQGEGRRIHLFLGPGLKLGCERYSVTINQVITDNGSLQVSPLPD